MLTLGLDIGGANTKLATADGSLARSFYAPLWKDRSALRKVLAAFCQSSPVSASDSVGVVMTAQLCDCFRTKSEGILHICSTVKSFFENARFFSAEGTFATAREVSEQPMRFDATNWLASAKFIAKAFKNAIFVDVGSTTTDIIPIVNGKVKAAKTDFERLKRKELIYEGVLRTNVSFLLREVSIEGEKIGVSSEVFAITADAYLALGLISAEEYTCDTPDFGGKTKEAALRRLSRVVCADLDELGVSAALSIAEQVKEAQVEHLKAALEEKSKKFRIKRIVSAGIGEFIVREAAEMLALEFISIADIYGKAVSAVFPAFSVANLLAEKQGCDVSMSEK